MSMDRWWAPQHLHGGAGYGAQVNIGIRLSTGAWCDGCVFDGCLAHAMLFNRTLDSEDVKLFASLVADDFF